MRNYQAKTDGIWRHVRVATLENLSKCDGRAVWIPPDGCIKVVRCVQDHDHQRILCYAPGSGAPVEVGCLEVHIHDDPVAPFVPVYASMNTAEEAAVAWSRRNDAAQRRAIEGMNAEAWNRTKLEELQRRIRARAPTQASATGWRIKGRKSAQGMAAKHLPDARALAVDEQAEGTAPPPSLPDDGIPF